MTPENKQALAPAQTPVQALLAKYQLDPAFKAAFDAAGPTEAAVQLAAQHGFRVSLRDVQTLGPASEALSDALLENIAGGGDDRLWPPSSPGVIPLNPALWT
jgi:predicted ribosomally synthesized peptide with nif11-like leader